jgi:Tfp pilus assembly major pilin PilA
MGTVSTGPQLIRAAEPRERNWLPLAIAAAVVVVVATIAVVAVEHGRSKPTMAPINATISPYAANLPITNLSLSESSNLAGGKVTYVDGHITNKGSQTVTGISVQVLFRDATHEVAQNETQPLKLIRTREPYVDLQSVADAPLKPGDERDFRLIFDPVTQDWDGAYPELRILSVQTR